MFTKNDTTFALSFFIFMIMVLWLAVACVPAEVEPSFGEPVPVTRDGSPTPFPLPTETAPAIELVGSVTPTPYETLDGELALSLTPGIEPPAVPPTPTPVPPFPGMIYQDSLGLWRVAGDWQPELLAELPVGAILSPDGRQALYLSGNDIWLVELDSREERNLTVGSGRGHCCAQWWPERPGTIIFGSWPLDSDLGPTTGFLSAVQSDGGGYTVLDEEVQSNGLPATGPDGQRIAYDRGGSSWIYRWDVGPEPLDPAAYGLTNVVRIGGPAWSPDGRQLAWTVAIEDPDWQIALAIFDLESQSAWLHHPYYNTGRGGWFPPPAWSPDGRWLAFVTEDLDAAMRGLWAIDVEEGDEIYLGFGNKPLWSPDNRWLVYQGFSEQGQDPTARLVEVGSWYMIQMYLPPGAMAVDWVE
jgi:hypothetical protein